MRASFDGEHYILIREQWTATETKFVRRWTKLEKTSKPLHRILRRGLERGAGMSEARGREGVSMLKRDHTRLHYQSGTEHEE